MYNFKKCANFSSSHFYNQTCTATLLKIAMPWKEKNRKDIAEQNKINLNTLRQKAECCLREVNNLRLSLLPRTTRF